MIPISPVSGYTNPIVHGFVNPADKMLVISGTIRNHSARKTLPIKNLIFQAHLQKHNTRNTHFSPGYSPYESRNDNAPASRIRF